MGLSMIVINAVFSLKKISIINRVRIIMKNRDTIFTFILENKSFIFISGLAVLIAIFIVISIMNTFLLLVGLNVIVSTGSPTLFLYTIFAKIVSIKLLVALIVSIITKQFKLEYVSLSIISVISMVLFGSINYYYLIPYVKGIMSLSLTNTINGFNKLSLFTYSTSCKDYNSENLAKGLYSVLITFPIIGRYVESFMISYNNRIFSPFIRSYNNPFKFTVNVYPLTSISKFNNKYMYKIVANKLFSLYLYEGMMDSLELQWKINDRSPSTALVLDFPFTYRNITSNVKWICSDQIMDLYSTVKDNSFENIRSYTKTTSNTFSPNLYNSLDFIRNNYNSSSLNKDKYLQGFTKVILCTDDYIEKSDVSIIHEVEQQLYTKLLLGTTEELLRLYNLVGRIYKPHIQLGVVCTKIRNFFYHVIVD